MAFKTHAEMIRDAITELKIAKPRDIMNYISKHYPDLEIKKESFRADIIGVSVNHSSSHHYPGNPKFLYYNKEDGTYELHDTEKHGNWGVSKDRAFLSDQDTPYEENEESFDNEESFNEAVISLEQDLEEYILRNLDQIEKGLKLYSNNNISGRQFTTDTGRIDILLVDDNKNYVVLELKVGTVKYSVIGQILGYIHDVRLTISKGQEVRGVIIADEFDNRLIAAASEIPHVSLKKYRVHFTFEDINKSNP